MLGINHFCGILDAREKPWETWHKMTCDQEHYTQRDTAWRHNGIWNWYTDENSMRGWKFMHEIFKNMCVIFEDQLHDNFTANIQA